MASAKSLKFLQELSNSDGYYKTNNREGHLLNIFLLCFVTLIDFLTRFQLKIGLLFQCKIGKPLYLNACLTHFFFAFSAESEANLWSNSFCGKKHEETAKMTLLSGGDNVIKYLLFIFNFLFVVSWQSYWLSVVLMLWRKVKVYLTYLSGDWKSRGCHYVLNFILDLLIDYCSGWYIFSHLSSKFLDVGNLGNIFSCVNCEPTMNQPSINSIAKC